MGGYLKVPSNNSEFVADICGNLANNFDIADGIFVYSIVCCLVVGNVVKKRLVGLALMAHLRCSRFCSNFF